VSLPMLTPEQLAVLTDLERVRVRVLEGYAAETGDVRERALRELHLWLGIADGKIALQAERQRAEQYREALCHVALCSGCAEDGLCAEVAEVVEAARASQQQGAEL